MSVKLKFSTLNFRLRTAPTAGFFLRSDANGNGSWVQFPNTTFPDGSAATPGIPFSSDVTTGFFYSAGTLGISVGGTSVLTSTSTVASLSNGRTLNIGTSGTTSPLNVFGLITGNNGLTISAGTTSLQSLTCGGLATGNAGLTVSNGQTMNVGTSGTTSPLNVFGLASFNNGLNVSGAVSTFTKTGSTTLSTGTLYVNPAAFTAGGSAVYYSYFASPTITTTAVTEAYTIFAASPVATGPPVTRPYNLFANGGISYINSGLRYDVITVAGTTYTALQTDFIVIMESNTGGTKTVTLPLITANNIGQRYIIATRRSRTININRTAPNTFLGGATTITISGGPGMRIITAISLTQWSVG